MGKKNLPISYVRNSSTIIDPMYSILDYLNIIPFNQDIFSGVSSLVFRFSVNRKLDFPSTFIYNWNENWLATDFIGIYSKMYSSYTDDFTFPLYQKKLLHAIIKNINDDIPSIIWRDEFVVVKGYDDEKKVLIYTDGEAEHLLSYPELGYSSLPMWCIHLFSKDKIILDEKELYLESIFQAVYKARSHDPSLSEEHYACGLKVYDFINDALKDRLTLDESTIRTLKTFSALKHQLSNYFHAIKWKMPELAATLDQLDNLSDVFSTIKEQLYSGKPASLIPLFTQAKKFETNFFQSLEETYQVEFHNRMGSIWLR
ncbi:hypothetical protein ACFSO7_12940 [Bacillus sp. CGMCC 1.16607]|uniref:hypothetical protein n=1 Tax=Bacillus sp. CGMCC 1.16607 TaxID=3351842 RepID=UPI003630EB7C